MKFSACGGPDGRPEVTRGLAGIAQMQPRAAEDLTEVAAECGRIQGIQCGQVRVFRGIPYGAAPVAERRFAPPTAAARFAESFGAFAFGAISEQDIDPLPEAVPGTENLFYASGVSTSEDCLNLNVWAPTGAEAAPVLVYIHGGGFLCGSGSGPWIDGAHHAREHGLVVVTLNYRLGILGGLYLGEHEPTSSNLGLQDQLLALRWVRTNIAAFGGDPDRITVAGESAGAMSVAAMLFAPGAEGLFRRAVVESGHLDAALSTDEARAATRRVLAELHIDATAPDVLGRLRATSLLRILAVQRRLGIAARLFPLVDDGVVLRGVLTPASMPDWARDVDLLVGTTQEENRLFTITGWGSEPQTPELSLAHLLDDPVDRAAALSLYGPDTGLGDDATGISHRIVTERAWSEPARRLALAHADGPGRTADNASRKSPAGRTYNYEFAWRSSALDGRVGAAHVVDIPFFFGNLGAPGVAELLGERVRDGATIQLAQRTSAALARFVATGDLNESELGRWPAFTSEQRTSVVIDVEPTVVLDRAAPRLDFWEQHRGTLTDTLDAATGGKP